jgi:hypothetical protein
MENTPANMLVESVAGYSEGLTRREVEGIMTNE